MACTGQGSDQVLLAVASREETMTPAGVGPGFLRSRVQPLGVTGGQVSVGGGRESRGGKLEPGRQASSLRRPGGGDLPFRCLFAAPAPGRSCLGPPHIGPAELPCPGVDSTQLQGSPRINPGAEPPPVLPAPLHLGPETGGKFQDPPSQIPSWRQWPSLHWLHMHYVWLRVHCVCLRVHCVSTVLARAGGCQVLPTRLLALELACGEPRLAAWQQLASHGDGGGRGHEVLAPAVCQLRERWIRAPRARNSRFLGSLEPGESCRAPCPVPASKGPGEAPVQGRRQGPPDRLPAFPGAEGLVGG